MDNLKPRNSPLPGPEVVDRQRMLKNHCTNNSRLNAMVRSPTLRGLGRNCLAFPKVPGTPHISPIRLKCLQMKRAVPAFQSRSKSTDAYELILHLYVSELKRATTTMLVHIICHIKMEEPVTCVAQEHNKRTCWLFFHSIHFVLSVIQESCEFPKMCGLKIIVKKFHLSRIAAHFLFH